MVLCTNSQISHLIQPTPLQARFTTKKKKTCNLSRLPSHPLFFFLSPSLSSWCYPPPPDPHAPEPVTPDPLTPKPTDTDPLTSEPIVAGCLDMPVIIHLATSPPSPTPSLSPSRKVHGAPSDSPRPERHGGCCPQRRWRICGPIQFLPFICPFFITISEFPPI